VFIGEKEGVAVGRSVDEIIELCMFVSVGLIDFIIPNALWVEFLVFCEGFGMSAYWFLGLAVRVGFCGRMLLTAGVCFGLDGRLGLTAGAVFGLEVMFPMGLSEDNRVGL
jgi:hypothetical protein